MARDSSNVNIVENFDSVDSGIRVEHGVRTPKRRTPFLRWMRDGYNSVVVILHRLGTQLDPNVNGTPRTRTVVAALLGLVVYFIIGGFAIKYPNDVWRPVALAVAATVESMIVGSAAADFFSSEERLYRRNVANTVLTCFFTILVTTVLYVTHWHSARNSYKLTMSSESLDHAPWPAVVVMQDILAPYQANFDDKQEWRCFVGKNEDHAPACSSRSIAHLSLPAEPTGGSCNCSDYYDRRIQEGFIGRDSKRFISFLPPPNFVVGNVQTFLNLHIAFNYNSSKDVKDDWNIRGYPNFWLLVYDPTIPAQEAYKSGTAGLTLINANGFTTVTLTPSYFKRRDSLPHYEYDAQVSTTPMLDVVCDVAERNMKLADAKVKGPNDNAYATCYAFIAIRYANLERETATERPVMEWGDVVMSVGSYFALVQFVCWVVSGLAWTDPGSRL